MIYAGTANYVSKTHIKNQYYASTEIMLEEGMVLVGKPTLKEGQTLRVDDRGRYHIGTPEKKDIQKKETQRKRATNKKAIYITVEDPRETGFQRGAGIVGKVFHSKKEVCEFLLKRVWYFEPNQRTWIEEVRKELGPIKAWHDRVQTGWLYCPTYVKRFVKIA